MSENQNDNEKSEMLGLTSRGLLSSTAVDIEQGEGEIAKVIDEKSSLSINSIDEES